MSSSSDIFYLYIKKAMTQTYPYIRNIYIDSRGAQPCSRAEGGKTSAETPPISSVSPRAERGSERIRHRIYGDFMRRRIGAFLE
jgi:hypothetical protein